MKLPAASAIAMEEPQRLDGLYPGVGHNIGSVGFETSDVSVAPVAGTDGNPNSIAGTARDHRTLLLLLLLLAVSEFVGGSCS